MIDTLLQWPMSHAHSSEPSKSAVVLGVWLHDNGLENAVLRVGWWAWCRRGCVCRTLAGRRCAGQVCRGQRYDPTGVKHCRQGNNILCPIRHWGCQIHELVAGPTMHPPPIYRSAAPLPSPLKTRWLVLVYFVISSFMRKSRQDETTLKGRSRRTQTGGVEFRWGHKHRAFSCCCILTRF